MSKKIKILSLSFCALFFLTLGAGVFAETTPTNKPDVGSDLPKFSNPFGSPKLSVSIPGFKGFREIFCETTSDGKGQNCYVPWLADYIKALYVYGIGSLMILAVIVMMIGGVVWLTAGGNEQRIADAKQWINGSLLGVLIAVSSYLILNIINPALTELSPIKLASVQKEDLPDFPDYQALIEESNNGETTAGNFKPGPKNIKLVEVETLSGPKKIQIDESIVEATQKAFREMKAIGFDVKAISDYRPTSKFCHGAGLAVDINANENYCVDCYGEKGAKVLGKNSFFRPSDGPGSGKDYTPSNLSMTKKVIEIWTNAGWCWGGNWRTIKDYMHFSAPHCTRGSECGTGGKYDFTESVKKNQQDLGITYP